MPLQLLLRLLASFGGFAGGARGASALAGRSIPFLGKQVPKTFGSGGVGNLGAGFAGSVGAEALVDQIFPDPITNGENIDALVAGQFSGIPEVNDVNTLLNAEQLPNQGSLVPSQGLF